MSEKKTAARASSFMLGGHRIPRGKRVELKLKVSETYTGDDLGMPVCVIRARNPGPVVFVSAALHGDEINGTGIIHDLMFGEPVSLIKGTLILIPVINVFGFENNMRYLPDRRDLNRSFPGSISGSLASRMAQIFMREIVSKCDYGIDLHSAAAQRTNYPNVRANLRNHGARQIAEAFGCELVISGQGPDGSLRREACRAGCPTIILEAGEPLKIEPAVLEIGVRGVRNVLKSLGMLKGSPVYPSYRLTIRSTSWIRASVGGILRFHVQPGETVSAGQPLATNFNLLGKENSTLISPFNGIIIGMTTMPAVKPGEPVCHIAKLSRKSMSMISPDRLHRRASRHLATNIPMLDPPV